MVEGVDVDFGGECEVEVNAGGVCKVDMDVSN